MSVIVLCFVVRYFMSILVSQSSSMGKRELVALLHLSSWCLVMVERLYSSRGATGLSAVCDCGIS